MRPYARVIWDELDEERQRLGLSIQDVSMLVGVHPQTIAQWRGKPDRTPHGRYEGRIEEAKRLLEAMKISGYLPIPENLSGRDATLYKRRMILAFQRGGEFNEKP